MANPVDTVYSKQRLIQYISCVQQAFANETAHLQENGIGLSIFYVLLSQIAREEYDMSLG